MWRGRSGDVSKYRWHAALLRVARPIALKESRMHASAKERCGMSNSLTRGVGDALVWINKVFLRRMARFAGGGAGALVLVTALFAVTESAGASPSWKVLSSPKGGGLPLGLSCLSARFCVAVGQGRSTEPLLATWNGHAWTDGTTPALSGISALAGIACTSTRSCWAVGEVNGRALIEHSSGYRWTVVNVTHGSYSLSGVSCPTSNFSMTVGHSRVRSAILTRRGDHWSTLQTRAGS